MSDRRGFLWREAGSFACAFRGIAALLKSEVHARIHLTASIAVILLGWWFGITRGEWIAIVLAIGIVLHDVPAGRTVAGNPARLIGA